MTKKKEKINILFASPEVMPFAGTGGLGEVAGSLPAAVNALSKAEHTGKRKKNNPEIDCRVIVPLYGSVKDEFRQQMKDLGNTEIPVAWRSQYMGIYELEYEGVIYYFVDNEFYFKRDRFYGFGDDCERFSFFSRAIVESAKLTGFEPDIIHANDWQTALVPVFCKTLCSDKGYKTVFTVHNVEYQGKYGLDMQQDCIGLPAEDEYLLRMGNDINLMKGAIYSADRFTTVSPNYAVELTYAISAFGLHEVVQRNLSKMQGILNGINTVAYDPENDPFIEAAFSADKLEGKKRCKTALQRQLGLPVRDVPMVTMITRLVAPKGIDLVVQMMDDFLNDNDIQFVMLGTGDKEYEDFFIGLQQRHPDQVRCMIEFNTATAHQIYAAGDILLMPSRSEACGLAQMIACRYGNVPIVRLVGGLADSIQEWNGEEGNGFTFFDFCREELENATRRALHLYKNRTEWEVLVKHILQEDFTWNRSAKEYYRLYKEMM